MRNKHNKTEIRFKTVAKGFTLGQERMYGSLNY